VGSRKLWFSSGEDAAVGMKDVQSILVSKSLHASQSSSNMEGGRYALMLQKKCNIRARRSLQFSR
jgi:hypothetical protein